jgi:hypothetical protein
MGRRGSSSTSGGTGNESSGVQRFDESSGVRRFDESSGVRQFDDPSSHPSSSRQAERVVGLPLAECWRLMWRVLQVDLLHLHQPSASFPRTTLESRRRGPPLRRSSAARRKKEEAQVTYGASVMAAAFGVGDVRYRYRFSLPSLAPVHRCVTALAQGPSVPAAVSHAVVRHCGLSLKLPGLKTVWCVRTRPLCLASMPASNLLTCAHVPCVPPLWLLLIDIAAPRAPLPTF